MLARTQPSTGFTGLTVTPDGLTVHWKGRVPAQVQKLVDASPVAVTIRPTAFSLAELDRAARELADSVAASGAAASRIGPSADFSAIEVSAASPVSTLAAQLAAGRSGIPVRYVVEPEAVPAYGRWDDTSPFWGGNAIDRLTDPILRHYTYCTTAFSVTKPNGTSGLLTAQHCGTNEEWRTPYGDALVGTSDGGNTTLDSVVITGSSYAPVVYVGDTNSSSGAAVTGAANPGVGSYVFASGSWSGASVLKVTAVNQYAVADGVTHGPGFWAVNEEGVASVGQGDSGGPVAGVNSDLQTVSARGLISMVSTGSYQGACVGRTSDGRICSTRSFHINIDAVTSGLGVSVATL
ncbi:hypothetical protein Kpho02_08280 [Kitasatospora phosalacinea]|uniref:Peptidase S1 domain-containing protein n=1 Tax=Kitasatospora phosalacinea TaxID=2065 RepID=A0A9W6Q4P7_9ACTN|nr:hypothetical protein [Kitasatospora phosalacinea]GLW68529.1 hypothetical protein Kpho02_08280 [Kitasatospora phosalacinea]